MSKPLVYLAGPITGTVEGEDDWREQCVKALAPTIVTLSPTRQTVERIDETGELTDADRLRLMQHGRSIAARDRFDVNRCDVLLVNLLGAKSVSIGTVGEIFWADAYRKPIVLVREAGNIHTHAMMDALASWIVPSLDQGLEIIRTLLASE
ncbi:nucleoside 2-deoxyribosyltransferase domain-containing protein [Sphingomonas sp. QA11]|uniref:nucleoside 2-deoxyribosyltransferase n=1 Tax=Sphingomonas sp. QA11 TaxID=2950605 RepID=UPI00234B9D8F|nr:nucleoside 2-deoxyribosyltransferase [Sphingomonas sp. QA11]WCM26337.1 nucleoside 2-deoxyribosyltransferase domain-containing protein [Sphingomonas sp. QA11]